MFGGAAAFGAVWEASQGTLDPTSTLLGRYILWNMPTNRDHLRFPSRPLSPAASPFRFRRARAPQVFDKVTIRKDGVETAVELAQLLEETGTTAFVIVRDQELLYESYPNGGSASTVNRCFSVTKSVLSALIGIAIAAGKLGGIDDRIKQYLPEFAHAPLGDLSIGHLLQMRSGIQFVEGMFPWSDEVKTYHSPNSRAAAFAARVTDPIGGYFHYNDYHPFLLAMILERATGEPVSSFLEHALWQRIGAEFPASVSYDSEASRLEHMESGLNACALDLAKFGLLYLNRGNWFGTEVIPEHWVDASTSPARARTDPQYFRYYDKLPWGRFLASGRYYYKYLWWGYRASENEHDYFAMGVLGQHVYVSPRTRVVIVRLSDRFPKGMWWVPVFRQLALQAS